MLINNSKWRFLCLKYPGSISSCCPVFALTVILQNYQKHKGDFFNEATELQNAFLSCSTIRGSWCFILKWFTHTHTPFFSVCLQWMKIWWGLHLLWVSHICPFCRCTAPQSGRCTARRSETGSSPSTSCWRAISSVFGDCTGETCGSTQLIRTDQTLMCGNLSWMKRQNNEQGFSYIFSVIFGR